MNATSRKPLRHIICAVLPKRTPPSTARRLTVALLLQIREWRADQRHRPSFDAPRLIAERDGLLNVSDSARRALQKARRELGLSADFQAAVDDAVEVRREQTVEHGLNRCFADVDIEDHNHPFPGNPYGISPIRRDVGPLVSFNDLSPAEALDVHLAHAIAGLREWDKDHRKPAHRPSLESTRLANDLYSIAESAGLTRMEIGDLLDALNGSSGLPAFCVETIQRSRDGANQRARTLSVKSQG